MWPILLLECTNQSIPDSWSCNFAKYSLSLIIKRCKLFNWNYCEVFIYIYIIYCRYMEYLMKLIFISSNSRCDFLKSLYLKCIYFFIYFWTQERFLLNLFRRDNKIKFKMATSNLDVTHTFLYIVPLSRN